MWLAAGRSLRTVAIILPIFSVRLISSAYSEALDALGLKRYCCRRMVLTHVDLIQKLINYNSKWICAHERPDSSVTFLFNRIAAQSWRRSSRRKLNQ